MGAGGRPGRESQGGGGAVVMGYRPDNITMQVIRYGLEAIADDMGHNLVRMGRTTIVKEIMDLTCAVLDARGGILAQAHLCPLMLFSLPATAERMIREVGEFEDGDVLICNDPYRGGQHLLDVQFFAPVIADGTLVGFAANIVHQLDMGGAVPGGVAGGLTEIFQEGLRLPFLKLYRNGEERREIFELVGSNIRYPEKTLEDFRAQAATTLGGVQRVKKLIEKYGLEVFLRCSEMLLDYAEEITRKELLKVPDGSFTGFDYLDDDGVSAEPVRVQVNARKRGDELHVDFDGTSPQTKGNVNCPWSCSAGAVFYTTIGLLDPYMMVNSGTFRPIAVSAPEGSLVNPEPPAGVTARSQTMTKITEAMLKAMSRALPERVVAGSHGQACSNSFNGVDPRTGKRFSYIEILGGGGGARATKDGPDGQDLHLGRFMNTPVEAAELENPVRIERYEFLPDSGGAGRFRGGLSLRRDIRFLADVTWARYSDRQRFAPQGLFGGLEGAKGSYVLNSEVGEERSEKAKGVSSIRAGEVLSIRLPGSGGYGDPLERDAGTVEEDVRNGKVSSEAAREYYGVVLAPDGTVNRDETEALRQARRQR